MTIFEKIVISSWLIMLLTYAITRFADINDGIERGNLEKNPALLISAFIFLISVPISIGGGFLCLMIRLWS